MNTLGIFMIIKKYNKEFIILILKKGYSTNLLPNQLNKVKLKINIQKNLYLCVEYQRIYF